MLRIVWGFFIATWTALLIAILTSSAALVWLAFVFSLLAVLALAIDWFKSRVG